MHLLMARALDVIENPVSGERITWLVTAADSGGARLLWEYSLRPGGIGPPLHVHPRQEERFTVLSGTGRFYSGREQRILRADETITVAPGASHGFDNAGDDDLRLLVEVLPSLRMEQLFETIFALASQGEATRSGTPHLLHAALVARDCPDVAYAAGVPIGLQKTGIAVLSAIARLLGYRLPETG